MEEISDHAKNLTLSEDLEKPLEERVNLFYNFVKVSFPQLWILNLTLLTTFRRHFRSTSVNVAVNYHVTSCFS